MRDWGRQTFHTSAPNVGPMAANDDDNRTVTIEVEMADSESPEGMFQSVIQVRISSTEQHANRERSNSARHTNSTGRRVRGQGRAQALSAVRQCGLQWQHRRAISSAACALNHCLIRHSGRSESGATLAKSVSLIGLAD